MAELVREIMIDATPETIFPLLTTTEGMLRWEGTEGEIDLRLGAGDEACEPGAVGRAGGIEAGHPGIVAPPAQPAIGCATERPAAS